VKQPQIPNNELIRLDTLKSLNILDTPAEERFDRLTRLARRMFSVPIALVSLVDENRQWFKSCSGLDGSEVERDLSFCAHAILGDDMLVVADANADERFAGNPLVTGFPHIRFYAGCPLRHDNGSKLGTLCIIDNRPRQFSHEDLVDLRYLADMAERELATATLTTIDEVTKLSNRRGFCLLAEKSLSYCQRQGLPCTLVYFNLNRFKDINERLGPHEGDKALKIFSDKMQTNFRDSDVMARLGGDEFALLLNNTDSDLAEAIVDKFAALMKEFNAFSRLKYQLSFSRGIVTVRPHTGVNVEALLKDGETVMQHNRRLSRITQGILH